MPDTIPPVPNTEKPPFKTKFSESEKVLCFHGPLIYEAKCLKVQVKDKQVKYFIHYAGWNKNWDEWVPESRVLKLNDANISRQKDLQKAHEASLKNKKSKKEKKKITKEVGKDGGPGSGVCGTGGTSGNTSGGGGGDDSRSSTPSTDRSSSGPGKRSAASTPTTPASAKGDDSENRKKRSRMDNTVDTEDQFMTSVEVRIKLPDELKPALVDDWDLINRQRKLPIIPARVTVDTILADYIRAKTNTKNNTPNKESAVQEVVAGLREYFNVMLGTQLLYKFERPQYAEILQENKDKQASDIYGFIHLIRLFVRLGQMLAYTQLDEKSVTLLNFHLQDFLRFTVKNMETYYSIQDYGVAPPEYHRKAM
ncbi:mortality factor 4-like protein 1 isoform X3 [Panulirus ornatus]|uniref:mortality factor 4-like protein 1 isoform X3 n=1 Tax=Panulirus ornatus TaxID=150431 RepID=UPI003A867F73